MSVSFLGLFRAGGANAEQVKRETHIKNNATRISVSFANLDIFPIQRGEWFSENVIARFAPKLKRDSFNAVFGPNGQLEVIPQSLLVGRGMAFDVYADSDSLDYLYEHFSAGADAGFFIGWWKVGGEGGYSSTHEQTKLYKFADHIRVIDLSGRAKVIAVMAKEYGATIGAPQALAPDVAATLTSDAKKKAAENIQKEWLASKILMPFVEDQPLDVRRDIGTE